MNRLTLTIANAKRWHSYRKFYFYFLALKIVKKVSKCLVLVQTSIPVSLSLYHAKVVARRWPNEIIFKVEDIRLLPSSIIK